ncbi:hypothetical protein L3Q67_44115 [Saccharothrix sp. AJ9571]|nr:hypothetical protein L3Q67_44115 [Saccharothrix sp. AJ9571]
MAYRVATTDPRHALADACAALLPGDDPALLTRCARCSRWRRSGGYADRWA